MIYIHVPFCKRFCIYCDFFSELYSEEEAERFADRVCEEISARSNEIDDRVKTLYFGGGTASVLPLTTLSRILIALDKSGHGGPYTEFTIEANPEDIVERGVNYVRSLCALGMNRLSLGVQSFDDNLLGWMNRRHDSARAVEAVRIAREAGVKNLSIDLIFGLSNLSDEVWEDTLDKAVALGVEHISCYQLTVEGDCALAGMVRDGLYEEASDDLCARQYDLLCRKLAEAGYHHYEISNFALPGFEAIHNGGYWQRIPYAGFGPSAHSFSGKRRSWNSPVLNDYVLTEETLSDEDCAVETIMLALRRDIGIDAPTLEKLCSKEAIDKLIAEGALRKADGRYSIPEDHFFVSDQIIRELI